MAGKMSVDCILSHKYLKPGVAQPVYLMLQFTQPKVETKEGRKPVNVSFVLDRSGSMHGDKLDYTKKAVTFALEHLEPSDIVSVVAFDDQVNVLVPAEKAQHKDQMVQAVKRLYPGGCTNLSGGLLKGAREVKKNLSDDFVNRVILLTDGLANEGITEPAKIVAKAKGLKEKKLSVSTLGVGDDFQEDLLVDMAEGGGGNFYFIANPDQVPEIFRQELQGLLSITGQNLELAIKPAGDVEVSAILGYRPSWGQEVTVSLPDMYSGDIKTVLVELIVRPEAKGMMPLGQIRFTYDDVLEDLATVSYDVSIGLEVTDEPSLLEKGHDIRVTKEVEIFRAAEAKEEAIRLADEGNYSQAREVLKNQSGKLRSLYSLTGDKEIEEELSKLEQNSCMMAEDSLSPYARKEMKYQSYMNRNKR